MLIRPTRKNTLRSPRSGSAHEAEGGRHWIHCIAVAICVCVTACGGDGEPPEPIAKKSALQVTDSVPGGTPFIQFVSIDGAEIAEARSFRFVVQPKGGYVSKPVSATYKREYLIRRGYASSGATK